MKTILVVDDEGHILQTVTIALELEGFQVIAAASAQEAVERVSSQGDREIDFLLCDINMPDQDGFHLLERLQKELGFLKLPVAFMTGLPIQEHHDRAEKVQARALLKKPFQLRELIKLIKNELGLD